MEKKSLPLVHCEYAAGGSDISEILEESFRLYLIHTLAAPEIPVVSYPG